MISVKLACSLAVLMLGLTDAAAPLDTRKRVRAELGWRGGVIVVLYGCSLLDHRLSHSYNAETEHVRFLPTALGGEGAGVVYQNRSSPCYRYTILLTSHLREIVVSEQCHTGFSQHIA